MSILISWNRHVPPWGRQSCLQAAFRPPSALNRPLTQFARIVSGFVSRGHGAAKPEKFASKEGGGLKPASSQDWLPHENAKLQRRPERPPCAPFHKCGGTPSGTQESLKSATLFPFLPTCRPEPAPDSAHRRAITEAKQAIFQSPRSPQNEKIERTHGGQGSLTSGAPRWGCLPESPRAPACRRSPMRPRSCRSIRYPSACAAADWRRSPLCGQ